MKSAMNNTINNTTNSVITMNKMTMMVTLVAVVLLSSTQGFAKENNSEYYQTFLKYLRVSGVETQQKMALKMMFTQFKKAAKSNPEALEKIEKVMGEELPIINERLFTVYKKHLSHDDLKAIVAFYESEAGQRLQKSQPKILQESMMIGQEWGKEVARKVMQDIKK